MTTSTLTENSKEGKAVYRKKISIETNCKKYYCKTSGWRH